MVSQLSARFPDTWGTLPKALWAFGSGGINSSGIVCGNVNGCIAVLTQLSAPTNVKDHFLRWFEKTALPTNAAYEDYRSGTWVPGGTTGGVWGGSGMPIPLNNAPRVKPESLSCHAAHTRWKVAASSWLVLQGSAANSDRCSKTTYDSVYKLATLINEWKAGAAIDGSLDPSVATCKTSGCHSGAECYPETGVGGKMKCEPCHRTNAAIVPNHGY